MLSVLLWGLAAILALLLVVLLMPWRVRVVGCTSPMSGRVEVGLLNGRAPPIRVPLRGRRNQSRTKPQSDIGKALRPRPSRRPRGLVDLGLGLLSAVHLGDVRLSGRIGLDDPADTGVVWGWVAAIVPGLTGPGRSIDLSPDFSGRSFDLQGSADVVLHPPRILRAATVFVWANRRGVS